jgi:glyoxylase-like metal-dependent hydrolase (beta-lactamase superfamily II)
MVMSLPLCTLRADNLGPFTGAGTNTYCLGQATKIIVDPGPDMPAHLAAILANVGRLEVEAILVTHAHSDHSGLAMRLSRLTGAPILAFGDARAGMSAQMTALEAEGIAGGEGRDDDFAPDLCLTDGQILSLAGLEIEVIHTPGHMSNHICLGVGDTLLSGDHVMAWSTSLVSPPDGDMAAYMASLHKLAQRTWRRFLPGHGLPVEDPAARLAALIQHRLGREASVLAALAQGPATAEALTKTIYTDLAPNLHGAATRNVLAHLIDLQARAKVARLGPGALSAATFGLS